MLNKLHGQPDSYDKKCVHDQHDVLDITVAARVITVDTDPSINLERH